MTKCELEKLFEIRPQSDVCPDIVEPFSPRNSYGGTLVLSQPYETMNQGQRLQAVNDVEALAALIITPEYMPLVEYNYTPFLHGQKNPVAAIKWFYKGR